MGNENCLKLSELNTDILLEVFTYLPLRDRKNARLVCRKWRQVCCRRIFAKTEAFFIPCWYALPAAVKVLQRFENETLNLKFYLLRIDKVFDTLWETCGSRITSLQFHMCELDAKIVAKIFNLCPNLIEFSALEECSFADSYVSSCKFFMEMHDKSMAATDELSTLCLEYPLCERDLLYIASTFPNLKNIDLHLRTSEPKDGEKSTNFRKMLELLRSRFYRFEKLRLTLLPRRSHYALDLDGVSEFDWSALKSMSLSAYPSMLQDENLNTFLRYKFWTKLEIEDSELWTGERLSPLSSAILARLLDENPQLEEFSFTLEPENVVELSVVFAALVKSNVKTLTINACDFMYPAGVDDGVTLEECILDAEMSSMPLTRNRSVLRLKIEASGSQLSSLFLKYFRNIRYLYVIPGNAADIFAYQTNLRALTIGQYLDIGGYTPTVQPLRTIKTLEFFQIRSYGVDLMFGYAFPNLKYFVYDKETCGARRCPLDSAKPNEDGVIVNDLDALMSHLRRHSPRLRGINLFSSNRVRGNAFAKFFGSCLNFRQLRYISLPCCATNVEKADLKRQMSEYLSRCSSLRAAWVDVLNDFKICMFFNDDSEKFEFSEPCFSHLHFSKTLFQCWRHER